VLTHSIRPTTRELFNRLNEARTLLSAKDGIFVDHAKIVGELNALHIGDSSEVWDLIRTLLNEINPGHYAGGRPPQKAYERSIEGRELFAVSWDSQHLGKRMYLKFAIKGDLYVYVSLHRDRPLKKGP